MCPRCSIVPPLRQQIISALSSGAKGACLSLKHTRTLLLSTSGPVQPVIIKPIYCRKVTYQHLALFCLCCAAILSVWEGKFKGFMMSVKVCYNLEENMFAFMPFTFVRLLLVVLWSNRVFMQSSSLLKPHKLQSCCSNLLKFWAHSKGFWKNTKYVHLRAHEK